MADPSLGRRGLPGIYSLVIPTPSVIPYIHHTAAVPTEFAVKKTKGQVCTILVQYVVHTRYGRNGVVDNDLCCVSKRNFANQNATKTIAGTHT